MKRFLRSEAGATVLWVVSSLVLGAVILPWLYQGGKWLGEAAATRDLPAVLEWLGASCERAKLGRYYSRALLVSALVLLPFLFRRIRVVREKSQRTCEMGSRVSWKSGVFQAVVGCVIAGGILWSLGLLLYQSGAYVAAPKEPGFGKIVRAMVIPAVAASVLEEWLFRGLLLGLWLRVSKVSTACVGTSLFFAFIHFLEPPKGVVVADPASVLAGFELLGKILYHFTDPRFFITDFATLFVVGMILAWTRLRTGGLWFPIGLHAGWILAFKGCSLFFKSVPAHPLHPWALGNSLRSGLLPILTLAVTAVICHLVLGYLERRKLAC